MKLVEIQWYDAKFDPGPQKMSNFAKLKLSLFQSVGYLLSQDNTTTVIASEFSDDGDYRDITIIPTGSVVSVKELVFSV